MCDAMGDVSRDGLRRVVAKWREARPIVDVDQHGAVGLRKGDIAPEHLEPEDRRGLERERLEPVLVHHGPLAREPDRKSTRLNSSHRCISYAVFCLKKKKNKERQDAGQIERSLPKTRDKQQASRAREV